MIGVALGAAAVPVLHEERVELHPEGATVLVVVEGRARGEEELGGLLLGQSGGGGVLGDLDLLFVGCEKDFLLEISS